LAGRGSGLTAAPAFFTAHLLEGRLDIELEDRTVSLGPHEGFTVPKGVMHFPHARGRVVVLMVEKGSVVPTGS